MNNFSIGNNGNVIIRNCGHSQIGNIPMTYKNEPYTVLHSAKIELDFMSESSQTKIGINNILSYNIDKLNSISIADVPLTDKIINLIFSQLNGGFISLSENNESDENGELFLKNFYNEFFNIYIYSKDKKVAKFIQKLEGNKVSELEPDTNYLIFYETFVNDDCFKLEKKSNLYLTLDLELEGNTNDTTTKQWIHIDKACLNIDKRVSLSDKLSTVDLNFNVINDKTTNNYIVLSKGE